MATIIYTEFTGTIAVCVAWVVFSLRMFMNKLTSTTFICKTCWTCLYGIYLEDAPPFRLISLGVVAAAVGAGANSTTYAAPEREVHAVVTGHIVTRPPNRAATRVFVKRRRSNIVAILGCRPKEFVCRLERAAQCLAQVVVKIACFGFVIVGVLAHDHLPAAVLVEIAAVLTGHVDKLKWVAT